MRVLAAGRCPRVATAREVSVHGGEDGFDAGALRCDAVAPFGVVVGARRGRAVTVAAFGLQLRGGGDFVGRDRFGDEPGEPAEWMPLLVDVDVAGHARSESVDVLEQLVHRPASLYEAVAGHGVTDVPDVLAS